MDKLDRGKGARSVKPRQKRPTPKTLFYRAVPHRPDELVFAEAAEAERISQIRHALTTAKTWGEFKALMPAKDFSKVLDSYVEDTEDVIEPPSEQEPFDFTCARGFEEGDYPTWLQAKMDRIIPYSILQKFGSLQSTFLNGSYWGISSTSETEIVLELRQLGYVVARRDDLNFY
jgi:hypothetical protein